MISKCIMRNGRSGSFVLSLIEAMAILLYYFTPMIQSAYIYTLCLKKIHVTTSSTIT